MKMNYITPETRKVLVAMEEQLLSYSKMKMGDSPAEPIVIGGDTGGDFEINAKRGSSWDAGDSGMFE